MEIYERIKAVRESKRFSQYNMADLLNISQSAYLQIEKGKTELTVSRLYQIAEVLEVSVVELLGVESKAGAGQSERIEILEKETEDLKRINDGYKALYTEYLNKLQHLYLDILIYVRFSLIESALSSGILTKSRYTDWLVEVKKGEDGHYTFSIDVEAVETKGLDADSFDLTNFLSEKEIFECLHMQNEQFFVEMTRLVSTGLIDDKGLERAFWKYQKIKHFPDRKVEFSETLTGKTAY